ncbi:MAG: hypothetical protein ABSB40_01485 [Nitrososphaeria archaeon]
MVEEECPNCKEKISVQDNIVVKKIGGKTMKFCSLACADAYKEVGKKREESTKEKKDPIVKGFWSDPTV